MNVPASGYLSTVKDLLGGRRPGPFDSRKQIFGETDDAFWFWLNTEGLRTDERLRGLLPGLPDEELQARTIGSSGDAALKEAFDAYTLFTGLYRRHVGALGDNTRVLDFGCGWGRMLRFFLRDVDQSNLWGVDGSRPLIDACRRTNPWCQFVEGRKMPPSAFASGYFDLVYSYSVFSHLSEAAHRLWLDELLRVLRPGGLLIATTWQREHIERSEQLRRAAPSSPSVWHHDLANLWMDNAHWLAEYDAGRFCYQAYPVETHAWSYHRGTSCYGEACIPERYVLNEWATALDVLEFIDDRSRCAQNVVVARRR